VRASSRNACNNPAFFFTSAWHVNKWPSTAHDAHQGGSVTCAPGAPLLPLGPIDGARFAVLLLLLLLPLLLLVVLLLLLLPPSS
jgi:hypothetical protein